MITQYYTVSSSSPQCSHPDQVIQMLPDSNRIKKHLLFWTLWPHFPCPRKWWGLTLLWSTRKSKSRSGSAMDAAILAGGGERLLGSSRELDVEGQVQKIQKNAEKRGREDDWVFGRTQTMEVLSFCSLYCQKVASKMLRQNSLAYLTLNPWEILRSNPLLCTPSPVQCPKRHETVGTCSSTASTLSQEALKAVPVWVDWTGKAGGTG